MNRTSTIIIGLVVAVLIVALILVGWGVSVYNKIVTAHESVRAGWSQVENQYQRRLDLVPNLVETVKGFAKQEREVLENVTNARARVGQMTVTPGMINNPEAFAQFQQAQDGLGSALSRLLAVSENYPTLKSNENFLALQSQLEGTENRIAVERRRYNDAVQHFNVLTRWFPGSLIASFTGFHEAAYFKSIQGADSAPKVRF